MRSGSLPPGFFKNNRSKLAERLSGDSLAIICSNHKMPRNGDQYHPFRQHSDFYYLTGIVQEESILLIFSGSAGQKLNEILFVLKPTPEMEIWEGHKLSHSEATSISGIEQVHWFDDFDNILAEAVKSIDKIYYNFPENPKFSPKVKPYDYLISEHIENRFPGLRRDRLAPVLIRLRMIKEAEEIDLIRQSARITGEAFKRVLSFTEPGRMEYEIEAEITHEFIRSGATGHAYEPIIASGKNALVLHYIENRNVCTDADLLLMDFGAEWGCYASDCTRTIPVSGSFTERQRQVYDSTLRVLRKAISMMTVGQLMDDFHASVGLLWQEEHIRLGLYTDEDVNRQDTGKPLWKSFFNHGTSHSIGLDVHDPFDRTVSFSPGMVLSCEPAIYIAGENLGIRLENTILITEEGPVDLMNDIPIDPDEIEALMHQRY